MSNLNYLIDKSILRISLWLKAKYFFIIILTFAPALIFSHSNLKDSKVLAVVGSHQITFNEFNNRYEDYLIYSGVQDNLQLRFSILNNMVNEILLQNYDDNSKINNNSEYKKEIKWAKNETILAFLKDQEIYSKIVVSDEELREAFKRSNVKLAVRHLYAPTEEAANKLYELLKIGVSFEQLAKQVFTDSILQNNGGYLGYISWGQTDPGFENAAYALKVGEISKPVKTAQGYSVIKLEDRVENPLISENDFLNKKHKLERAVKISKKIPYEKVYLKKIFWENKIEFNEKAIKNILNDLRKKDYNIEAVSSSKTNYENSAFYQGKKYSLSELKTLLDEVPKYNLEKLSSVKNIKEAILGILMQNKLLKIADNKGYDTLSYVKDTFNKLANNIFLNYKRTEVINKINISDSELVKYYNDNISYFLNENEMNVKEIIIGDPLIVINVKEKLTSGYDFGKLAEKFSLRKWSAENKGEIGLSPVSKYGELKDTLWKTPLGKIIGPMKIGKYFGFFKVIAKQDGKPEDFDFVKPKILNAVRNEKGFPYMKKHLEDLSKKIDIKISDEMIKNYKINLAGVN
jgi:parvulin-like peptidyl-prolyl isomerase